MWKEDTITLLGINRGIPFESYSSSATDSPFLWSLPLPFLSHSIMDPNILFDYYNEDETEEIIKSAINEHTVEQNEYAFKSNGDEVESKAIKKIFRLPVDQSSFETFIDHGTTLDTEGYPLFPDRGTVYVKMPKQTITNWGTVGYSYSKSGAHGRDEGDWKTFRINCLGVIRCKNPECDYLGSTFTARGKMDEWESV